MWDLVANLFTANSSDITDALAKQVVEASQSDVSKLVGDAVIEMSLAEARGFIRARSGLIVRKQTRIALGSHPQADSAWSPEIIRTATERLIPLVLRDLRVGVPRHVEIRIAA